MTANRAVSSVLDVTVCLLLVSASAVTLTHVSPTPEREPPDEADAVLETLLTATTWVNYTLSTTGSTQQPHDTYNRSAHGTTAGLLAAAAVSNSTVHDRPIAPSAIEFRRAVTAHLNRIVDRQNSEVQVIVRWQPYPGSHVSGSIAVGPSPPPDVNVHAASTSISWLSSESGRDTRSAARREGFRGMSSVVADDLIRTLALSESEQTTSRLSDSAWVRERRESIASAYGTTTRSEEGNGTEDELRPTIERTVESDLRNRFESPVEAARAISIGRVRLTVRTWSP